jgi:hypothetical protein
MPSEQDPLRTLADEMARQLSGAGGAAAVLLLERCGLLAAPERSPNRVSPGRIGVWEGGPRGYARAAALRDEWPFWADVPSIPPKGHRQRVVLLGESVARGFFYDPELNPALVLTASLTAALGQPVEVVDLAKTDLQLRELAALCDATLALAPDALVLFAGNNWSIRDPRDRHLQAATLREQGVPGLKALRGQRLAAYVESTLRQQLARLPPHLPMVLVVPEINLADWRLDAEADAPWLPPGRNRRWLEHRQAARSALAAGRIDHAAALAREMVDLDAGTAASGWTLLADCARAQGDSAAARACLETARDAHLWDSTYQTPRALTLVQNALRGCASPGRIAVVDLPRCFSAWQGGELPGRRLFLDYCHLTAEGIRVAMAATALEVAVLLAAGRALPTLASLVEAAPTPSARLEAAAHFGGALHSAHWGQGADVVSHLCHEAARRSPDVAQAMLAYLEMQTRRAPAWSCAATERLAAAATPFLCRYVLLQPEKLFDPILLPAIAAALEDNGVPAVALLAQLRQERSLADRPRDLLDPYHRASWADLDWLERPAHFRRAHAATSRFPWVASSPRAVTFEITCRRPPSRDLGACHLRVNGSPIAQLALTPDWSTHRCSAPAGLAQAGVNWLEIDWPLDLPTGEQELEHIAREHELGRLVPLLPVFGEVFSLRAWQS